MKRTILFVSIISLMLLLFGCGKKADVEIETEPIETFEVTEKETETETEEEIIEEDTDDSEEEITVWAKVVSYDEENQVAEVSPVGTLNGDTVFYASVPVSAFLDYIDDNVFAESGNKMNREMFYKILAINVLDSSWTEGSMYLFEMANAAELTMACSEGVSDIVKAYVHMEYDHPEIMDHIDYVVLSEDGQEVLIETLLDNEGNVTRTVNGAAWRTESSNQILQGLFSVAYDLYGEDMERYMSSANDTENEMTDEYVDEDVVVMPIEATSDHMTNAIRIIKRSADVLGKEISDTFCHLEINGTQYDLTDENFVNLLMQNGATRNDNESYVTFCMDEMKYFDIIYVNASLEEYGDYAYVSFSPEECDFFNYNGVDSGSSAKDVVSIFGEPTSTYNDDLLYNFEKGGVTLEVEFEFYEERLMSIVIVATGRS